MNQAPCELVYAIRPVAGVAPAARASRAQQSATAETLLRDLPVGAPVASSKAHARGLAAAAAVSAGRVGVDLEYIADGRDIAAIARWLMDAEPRDELAAYRAFTFREAYFKCEGAWPAKHVLRAVAAAEAEEFRTAEGLSALCEVVAPRFLLTLVWSAPVQPRRAAL